MDEEKNQRTELEQNSRNNPQEAEGDDAAHRAIPITGWAINTLSVLAIFAIFYLSSSLLLPLILATLLSLLLTPLVSRITNWGIPRPASALIIILGLSGSLLSGIYFLATPASSWIEEVPGAINSLQVELAPITRQIEDVSEAAKQVEDFADSDKQAAGQFVQIDGEDLR